MARTLLQSGLTRQEAALYRSAMYNLASEAFTAEPSAQMLADLAALASEARGEGKGVLDCESSLLSYLQSLTEEDREALRTRVATEYCELFVGPRRPLAPYRESLYRGYPNRMFTEITCRVREFYRRHGYIVAEMNRIPDDSIGYELKFMSVLAASEAQRLSEGSEDAADELVRSQLDFSEKHLGAWIHPFAEAIQQAYCADYYAAWARFVEDFVAFDIHFLHACMEEGGMGECTPPSNQKTRFRD